MTAQFELPNEDGDNNVLNTELSKRFKTKEEAEAEKIYAELSEAMADNLISERMLGDSWNEVFDNKNYAYSYFLEKENRIDLLELAEGMMNDVQQEKLSAMENCM